MTNRNLTWNPSSSRFRVNEQGVTYELPLYLGLLLREQLRSQPLQTHIHNWVKELPPEDKREVYIQGDTSR